MIKVTDVAYARFQAPDLDLMEGFLNDFGLTRSARTETSLYMRGTDKDHHLHITELGEPKFVGFAFNAASEEDLKIRGEGEVLGKKQSGMPSFKIADLSFDSDLLEDVRLYVNQISKTDPKLMSVNGENLKDLLYLFERDVAIKTLLAG